MRTEEGKERKVLVKHERKHGERCTLDDSAELAGRWFIRLIVTSLWRYSASRVKNLIVEAAGTCSWSLTGGVVDVAIEEIHRPFVFFYFVVILSTCMHR